MHTGILMQKLDRNSALGRPGHRWEDNIKTDLKSIGWGGVNWIDLAQDRNHWQAVVKTLMDFQVAYNV